LREANFAIYVTPEQLQGYLEATAWTCYIVVYVGLIFFWYGLVRYVESKEVSK
jgi:hypothetical protein